jgi:hypothetical protein
MAEIIRRDARYALPQTSKEALGFTASCLQDQADYLKKLGECADPAEAPKCQSDFVRQCWLRSREMPRLLDARGRIVHPRRRPHESGDLVPPWTPFKREAP